MLHCVDKLKWIANKAKQDKKWRFSTLAYLINKSSLAQCYKELNKKSACGVDGMSVQDYGENLQENIANLVTRMKAMKYKPRPVRRVLI